MSSIRSKAGAGGNAAAGDAPRTSSNQRGAGMVQPKSRLEEEQHPMTNTVILSALFQVCPVSQLKTFRLVCKQWRDLSLGPWRQQAVLQLDFLRDYENHMEPTNALNRLNRLPTIETKPFSACFDLRLLGKFKFESVTKLCILFQEIATRLTPIEIEWIAAVFPNVTDLRMPVTREQFPAVFKAFPKLGCLKLCRFDEQCDVRLGNEDLQNDETLRNYFDISKIYRDQRRNITNLGRGAAENIVVADKYPYKGED